MNNGVLAVVADGKGNLYVGGYFTAAGGVTVARIAKWDGSKWSAVAPGLNGVVNDILIDASGNLYVAGQFTMVYSIRCDNIAKWDGSAWSPLGTGMDVGSVVALAIGNGNLYAGGYFPTAGGVAVSRIARWDGAAWSALGGGMSADSGQDEGSVVVRSLALDGGGNLYAGGSFGGAGGVTARNIARWDGATWSSVGNQMDQFSELYALISIFEWSGARWSDIGSVVNEDFGKPEIYALVTDGSGNLYAGDWFTVAGGVDADYVARWDGSAWSGLGNWTYSGVNALTFDGNGNLYAGGGFTHADGVGANYIARWDGLTWTALGSGLGYYSVRDLMMDGKGNLFAGGFFASAGGKPSFNIAQWSGRPALAMDFASKGLLLHRDGKWSAIKASSPTLLGTHRSNLVASFPGPGLLQYNGSGWSSLSAKTNAEGMESVGAMLFVDFGPDGLYKYDGAMTRIHQANPGTLAAYGNNLVATFPPTGIHEYDGDGWKKISPSNKVEQMLGAGDVLYADRGAEGLYRYDGAWKKIRRANPDRMTLFGTKLVASFTGSGIYQYDGSTWKLLSRNANVENVVATPFALYVDRGAEGIYKYENGWKKISPSNPDTMCIHAGMLVVDFPATGVYAYNNRKWTRLKADTDAEAMTGVFFE